MLSNSILVEAVKSMQDSTHADATRVLAFSRDTEANYYSIARLIMKIDHWILDLLGLGHESKLFIILYAVLVFLFAFVIGRCLAWLIVRVSRVISKRFDNDLYSRFREQHFFSKSMRIVTPIVFIILIQFTLISSHSLAGWLTRLSWIYICYVIADTICTVISVVWAHLDQRANKRKLPLNGLVQLIKGIVWILAIIVALSILINRTPYSLLAGIGAFAAVLMLVFKDSILGVVAGVQLSENDSLHVGDWIKVPGTDANGTVIEVSLTEVKVRNWDKTVTTVPPYTLVSGSFTNYRDMQQSNSRRIQRSYMIDADSVVEVDDDSLTRFAEIPLLKDWIAKKIEQKSAGKVADTDNPEGLVDGSIETNLGIFRAYLKLYLDAHPMVDHTGDISFCFVTTLPQTSTGIPLQIYCFTNTSAWLSYEAIQASIFEHVAVMLYRFGLYTFENPSGRDTVIDGFLSPGKDVNLPFGVPYPFFKSQIFSKKNESEASASDSMTK